MCACVCGICRSTYTTHTYISNMQICPPHPPQPPCRVSLGPPCTQDNLMCVCICVYVLYIFVRIMHTPPLHWDQVSQVRNLGAKSVTTKIVKVIRTTNTEVSDATDGFKLTWRELWEVDVAKIMKEDFIDVDVDHTKYGYLPKMATCCKGSIGSLLASSFCERINSCANQVLNTGNTLLGDDEMEKLVMLRMNKDFMDFMRHEYPRVADEQFNDFGTVLTVEDNSDVEEMEEDF